MALESLSTESLALVNCIREYGEEVRVLRNVHTVVDEGELHLMRASLPSSEGETDSEPVWCFQRAPSALETLSEEIVVESAVLPVPDSTMIDLRNCDEFSIVHLEDVRDPSSQFVMLQTGSAAEVPAVVGNGPVLALSDGGPHAEGGKSPGFEARVPVEIVGAPAMFVGGNGRQWKRELELSSDFEGPHCHHPADVDSGIWDMVQALGSGVKESRRDEQCSDSLEWQVDPTARAEASLSVIQPSLRGMYKMFQIADSSGDSESGVGKEGDQNRSHSSGTKGAVRPSGAGGLEDALEPVAVLDFIVHRVEAETVRLERIDISDNMAVLGLGHQTVNQAGGSSGKVERSTNHRGLLVDCAPKVDDGHAADFSDGSCEDESTLQSNKMTTSVCVGNDSPAIQTYDSATNTPRLKKKHKDVVRVTSARFGRPLRRRVGSKSRTSWKDPNCEARKSVSADVSRSSSLLDIDDGQPKMAQSSEDAFSDPSPVHGECRTVKPTANQPVLLPQQPFTSTPYDWRHPGFTGTESHELFTDGSSSTASGPMASGFGLLAEPGLLNFDKFPDWMRDLPDSLVNIPLSDICIPGMDYFAAMTNHHHQHNNNC